MPNSIDPNPFVSLLFLLFVIFVYFMFFGIVAIPIIVLGIKRIRSAQNSKEKLIGYLSMLAIPTAFVFYWTVDWFESKGSLMNALWFVIMGLIHLVPLFILVKSLLKKKPTPPSTKKKNRQTKSKKAKK